LPFGAPAVLARIIESVAACAHAIGLLRLNLESSSAKANDLGRNVVEQSLLHITYCNSGADLHVGTERSLDLLS